jgi:hypothetical protein
MRLKLIIILSVLSAILFDGQASNVSSAAINYGSINRDKVAIAIRTTDEIAPMTPGRTSLGTCGSNVRISSAHSPSMLRHQALKMSYESFMTTITFMLAESAGSRH